MLLKKVFHYDNKQSFTTFCAMGSNIVMDKYFKFIDFIWIILWILTTLPIDPYQILSIRAFLLEGNLSGIADVSGLIIGQLIIFLSIYYSPL
jgi:hypothetical protein